MTHELLAWLSLCSDVQMTCIWPSWCHCHTVISCFIKIQIGLIFLPPAYPGCAEKEAVKWVSKFWKRTGKMSFLSQCHTIEGNIKHRPQIPAWPHPFFFHHGSTHRRDINPSCQPPDARSMKYGCEIWLLATVHNHDIIRNNGFKHF